MKLINDDLPKIPKSESTIIELTGLPGTCKKTLIDVLSKRFNGKVISLPNFSVTSLTGRALLEAIDKQPDRFPDWWAALSAANMYEQANILKAPGLKFVLNYKNGFKAWMYAAGVVNPERYIRSLPEPNITYAIIGNQYSYPSDLATDHLPTTLMRLQNWFELNRNPGVKVLNSKAKRFKAKGINNRLNLLIDHMTQDIVNAYKLPIESNHKVDFKTMNGRVIADG